VVEGAMGGVVRGELSLEIQYIVPLRRALAPGSDMGSIKRISGNRVIQDKAAT